MYKRVRWSTLTEKSAVVDVNSTFHDQLLTSRKEQDGRHQPVEKGSGHYVCKVAHLQVVVVVKAVWGIFNNTNTSLYLQVNTLLVIYKSCYYSIYYN